MVNYFLIYFGSVPKYLKYTVKAIKSSDENSKIYLLSDDQLDMDGVTNFSLEDIKGSKTKEVLSSNYYKSQINPLWNTSMARIFAIKDIANYLDINNDIIHFDADVLIYDDFNKYKNKFDSLKGLHITQTNSDELIFGFSYINDMTIFEKICTAMYRKLFESENIANKSNLDTKNYSFNEMRMLIASDNQLDFPNTDELTTAETDNGDGTWTYVITAGTNHYGPLALDVWLEEYITVLGPLANSPNTQPGDVITGISGGVFYFS